MRQELELAGLFQYFVLGPRVHGAFDKDLLDIHEPGFLEPGKIVLVPRNWTVIVFGGFDEDLGPVDKVTTRGERGVVRGETRVEFLEFEVAARLGVPGSMIVSE